MNKFSRGVDRYAAYILILPTVVFILLFSILPIAGSLRYAFFDLQLNDRSKNDMYTKTAVNMKLNEENNRYLLYFMDIEESVIEQEETKALTANVRAAVENFDDYLQGIAQNNTAEVQRVSQEVQDEIVRHQGTIRRALEQLYAADEEFYSEEDAFAVMDQYEQSLIQSNFVGLDNFAHVLKNRRVRSTMVFTLLFTFVSVFFELILGLALAMIMNKSLKGKGLIRTVSLIPWAIPTSVAALIWSYLYNGSSGIIAHLFTALNFIDSPAQLLTTASGAYWSIVIADVWKTTPYMALLLLAGLQVIPDSLYESSALDGASKWQQFFTITLPLLKPSIFVALLFRTLDAFRVFDLIYVLTGGGPGGSTESISVYAYKVMFSQTRFGYGSAIVLLMAIVVGILTLLYIKLLNVKLVDVD